MEWSPDSLAFFVDQTMYVKRTRADLRPGWKWVFDKPFFLILNLAVGGDWPGPPDLSTRFPQEMLVDYVRVYERASPSNTSQALSFSPAVQSPDDLLNKTRGNPEK